MALLKTFTVTRTVQLRQFEPVVYSATVEAQEDEDALDVIAYGQWIVDAAVGDLRDPLKAPPLPLSDSRVGEGSMDF